MGSIDGLLDALDEVVASLAAVELEAVPARERFVVLERLETAMRPAASGSR